jgi:siroheme synthase
MDPVEWSAVARVGGTLVVLMGVTERATIATSLIAGGMDEATPVAAIERASRADQRTVRTTLAGLAEAQIRPPATIVIGAVAGLDLRSEPVETAAEHARPTAGDTGSAGGPPSR